MSNIYIQEPPTSGKVLLQTTVGDIDIELWAKETPKACRNFIQLCMEGYYDATIFHRIVKGFIAQGGDPTGTGTGGESIYGDPFKDEFHTRLRFVRRGLVAMANGGKDDNASQFFFTLGPCNELQNKHTLFGKVTGNTLYNMLKLEESLVDSNDRPAYPHKIIKAQVLNNPFTDIEPRQITKLIDTDKKEQIKSKSKATKNYKLLSFGDEAEEDEIEADILAKESRGKGKSSHDLTKDPKLSSKTAVDLKSPVLKEDLESSEPPVKKQKTEEVKRMSSPESPRRDESRHDSRKPEPKGSKDEVKEKGKDSLPSTALEYQREKGKQLGEKKKTKGSAREEQTMALLAKFQAKLRTAKEKSEQEGGGGEEDDQGWLTHTLHFESETAVVAKDANVKDKDWYEIDDPRNPINQRRARQPTKDKR